MERRKQSRRKILHATAVQVTFVDVNGASQKVDARLLDESEQGVAIATPVHLASGSTVTIRADTNSETSTRLVDRKARVQWRRMVREGVYEAGLSLLDPPAADRPPAGNVKTEAGPEPAADYYELLQLSPKAAPDTVHRIFRILAQRYHPDNPDTGSAEMFRILMAAYDVLSDPEKRAAYDVRRAGSQELRWKIFDTAQATQGAEAERRKRQGILSLLYTKRLREPDRPALSLREMEDLLGCPREHLEFSLWYLKESGLIARADNARFTITIQGVDAAEVAEGRSKPLPTDRLLEASVA